jgi:hypothetical protein
MEITGKLIAFLTPQTGTSSKGDWIKQDIIIETAETYPKKICITFMKDKEFVSKIQAVALGSELTVHINIESREYNGKYYVNLACWKIQGSDGSSPAPGSSKAPANRQPSPSFASEPLPSDLRSDDDFDDESPF